MPTPAELGKRIKRARTERDLTLKQVEERSGVSATHISQIERGLTSPTIGALQKLSKAFELETSYFLEDIEVPDVTMVGAENSRVILSTSPLITIKSLTAGIPGSKLHLFRMIAQPGGDGPVLTHTHDGEECGTVIRGTMVVTVKGQDYVLSRGESIHFRATSPHGYRAVGTEESESIWVSTSVGFL